MDFVFIAYRDIPVYLRDSAFYLSLSADEPDEIIEIPADFYKPDDLISSEQDLVLLLNVIKFWGIDTIPNSLTQYLLDNEFPYVALLHDNTCQIFRDVRMIFGGGKVMGSSLKNAIMNKRTEVVNYLVEKRLDIEKPEIVGVAALVGRIDYLKLLYASGYTGEDNNEFIGAAFGDQVLCLRYLHEKNGILPILVVGAAIDGDAASCLEYANKNNCTIQHIMYDIICTGSAKCLAYAHQNGEAFLENTCTELIMARAHASKRIYNKFCSHLGCLKYVLANGYRPEAGSCKVACEQGTLDMLRVLHEHGATIDQVCANAAAKAGHLDVLMFLHAINCPWGEDTTTVAAMAGHLDCLRYAVDHSCAVHKDILLFAARRNQVQILQYLIEEQGMYMPENNALFEAAFERFHFESVAYLIDIGCPFADFQFFWLSALQPLNDSQYLKCIMYAVEHGWKNPASLMPTVKRVVHALPDCYKYLTELCGEDAGQGEAGRYS